MVIVHTVNHSQYSAFALSNISQQSLIFESLLQDSIFSHSQAAHTSTNTRNTEKSLRVVKMPHETAEFTENEVFITASLSVLSKESL